MYHLTSNVYGSAYKKSRNVVTGTRY